MSTMNLLDVIISKNMMNNKVASTQQKILVSAINLFSEKGYSNTSTSEIAKLGGVAEGTIFRYYKTKEKLLLSIVIPFIKEVILDVDKDIIRDVNPEKFERFEVFLKEFLNNRIKFLIENKEFFKIVIKEFVYRDDFRKDIIEKFKDIDIKFLKSLNGSLNRFKQSNEIRDIPNETIIRLMISSVASNFFTRILILEENKEFDYEEEINILIKFIMNGIGK